MLHVHNIAYTNNTGKVYSKKMKLKFFAITINYFLVFLGLERKLLFALGNSLRNITITSYLND